jgi:hypothetical protein
MVSLLGLLLFFFSSVANDDELGGLSSFFCLFFLGVKDDDVLLLSLGFFPQMQKMMMSWEAYGSLSFPRFFSQV